MVKPPSIYLIHAQMEELGPSLIHRAGSPKCLFIPASSMQINNTKETCLMLLRAKGKP